MAQFGADVEALEEFAGRLGRNADKFSSISVRFDTKIREAWWQGNDADAFRSDWESTYRPQLENIAEDFRSASQDLRRQVEEQRAISES